MKKTIFLLIGSLLALPAVALYFSEPLTALQWQAVKWTAYEFIGFAFFSFLVAEISKNYSQTDKLWSITPVVYAWTIAWIDGMEPRSILMAVLVSIWGLRLTLNFARRGGYSWKFWEGDEDYRWAILRKNPIFSSNWAWSLFNFFFIAFYQHGLILLITFPMVMTVGADGPLIAWDFMLAAALVGLVIYETVADNQQWRFQNEKHAYMTKTGQDGRTFEDGFNQRGLWALSRHPNYFAEQSIWVCLYLFSVVATGQWLNWSITGAVLLILLFRGSSDFSEGISAKRYPKYTTYQENVPRFIPNPFAAQKRT